MKAIHYVVVCILIGLFFFASYDEFQEYSSNGQRVSSYEHGIISRVYIENQKMIQVVETDGYNKGLNFVVTIEKGRIVDFEIISHQETEDYAGYITEEWFKERLLVSCVESLKVVKLSKENENEIVAVTGATITTDSIVNGVNNCIENYWRYLK